nr:MAG TPA: HIRUSTASIN-COAGULANT, PEPTIDIC INHIBITORS, CONFORMATIONAL FLEXIBILITY [Caudoviricetes sp.]
MWVSRNGCPFFCKIKEPSFRTALSLVRFSLV